MQFRGGFFILPLLLLLLPALPSVQAEEDIGDAVKFGDVVKLASSTDDDGSDSSTCYVWSLSGNNITWAEIAEQQTDNERIHIRPYATDSGQTGCVQQKEIVRIAKSSEGSNQCGLYGCRVLQYSSDDERYLKMGHGSAAENFLIEKEDESDGCVRYGDIITIRDFNRVTYHPSGGGYVCLFLTTDNGIDGIIEEKCSFRVLPYEYTSCS